MFYNQSAKISQFVHISRGVGHPFQLSLSPAASRFAWNFAVGPRSTVILGVAATEGHSLHPLCRTSLNQPRYHVRTYFTALYTAF